MKVNYPYLRKRSKNSDIRIEVMADSMRVGKTTAVKVIAEGLRKIGHVITESYEDWQHNPYLKGSYDDPEKNFLESQKWFIKRKWEQIKHGGEGIFIQDVSPEMDYCYALTSKELKRMSEENFVSYVKYYHSLRWNEAPAPSLLIYLGASDDVLIQRAMDSRREFETVDPEYFLMMKKVNRGWLRQVNDEYKTLYIDTDNLNFADSKQDKDRLISIVIDNITY